MGQITISRELLEQLFDFADNVQLYVDDWARDKYDVDSEWLFLSEKLNELLEQSEKPNVIPNEEVRYIIRWKSTYLSGQLNDEVSENEARQIIDEENEDAGYTCNYWGQGSDGSIIGVPS